MRKYFVKSLLILFISILNLYELNLVLQKDFKILHHDLFTENPNDDQYRTIMVDEKESLLFVIEFQINDLDFSDSQIKIFQIQNGKSQKSKISLYLKLNSESKKLSVQSEEINWREKNLEPSKNLNDLIVVNCFKNEEQLICWFGILIKFLKRNINIKNISIQNLDLNEETLMLEPTDFMTIDFFFGQTKTFLNSSIKDVYRFKNDVLNLTNDQLQKYIEGYARLIFSSSFFLEPPFTPVFRNRAKTNFSFIKNGNFQNKKFKLFNSFNKDIQRQLFYTGAFRFHITHVDPTIFNLKSVNQYVIFFRSEIFSYNLGNNDELDSNEIYSEIILLNFKLNSKSSFLLSHRLKNSNLDKNKSYKSEFKLFSKNEVGQIKEKIQTCHHSQENFNYFKFDLSYLKLIIKKPFIHNENVILEIDSDMECLKNKKLFLDTGFIWADVLNVYFTYGNANFKEVLTPFVYVWYDLHIFYNSHFMFPENSEDEFLAIHDEKLESIYCKENPFLLKSFSNNIYIDQFYEDYDMKNKSCEFRKTNIQCVPDCALCAGKKCLFCQEFFLLENNLCVDKKEKASNLEFISDFSLVLPKKSNIFNKDAFFFMNVEIDLSKFTDDKLNKPLQVFYQNNFIFSFMNFSKISNNELKVLIQGKDKKNKEIFQFYKKENLHSNNSSNSKVQINSIKFLFQKYRTILFDENFTNSQKSLNYLFHFTYLGNGSQIYFFQDEIFAENQMNAFPLSKTFTKKLKYTFSNKFFQIHYKCLNNCECQDSLLNKNGCKTNICPKNYYLKDQYARNFQKCEKCPEECLECVNSHCIKCKNNKTMNNFDLINWENNKYQFRYCKSNSDLENNLIFLSTNNENEIISTEDNYQNNINENNHKFNISKKIDLYDSIFQIFLKINCVQNCSFCLNNGQCQKCRKNFFLQNGNCKKFSKKLKCEKKFYLVDSPELNVNICNRCSSNCIKCLNMNECLICEESYKLDINKKCSKQVKNLYLKFEENINFKILQCKKVQNQKIKKCFNFVDFCSKYKKYSQNCLQCKQNFFLDSKINKCFPCQKNCLQCINSKICIKCKSNFILDSQNQCYSCSKNCLKCNKNICFKCLKGFVVDSKNPSKVFLIFSIPSINNNLLDICKRKCKISTKNNLYKDHVEEYFEPFSNNCEKCKDCMYCFHFDKSKKPCPSCQKCKNSLCSINKIKIRESEYKITFENFEYDLLYYEQAKKKQKNNFFIKKLDKSNFLIRVFDDSLKFQIFWNRIISKTCIPPKNLNIEITFKEKINLAKKTIQKIIKYEKLLYFLISLGFFSSFDPTSIIILLNINHLIFYFLPKNLNIQGFTFIIRLFRSSLFHFLSEKDTFFFRKLTKQDILYFNHESVKWNEYLTSDISLNNIKSILFVLVMKILFMMRIFRLKTKFSFKKNRKYIQFKTKREILKLKNKLLSKIKKDKRYLNVLWWFNHKKLFIFCEKTIVKFHKKRYFIMNLFVGILILDFSHLFFKFIKILKLKKGYFLKRIFIYNILILSLIIYFFIKSYERISYLKSFKNLEIKYVREIIQLKATIINSLLVFFILFIWNIFEFHSPNLMVNLMIFVHLFLFFLNKSIYFFRKKKMLLILISDFILSSILLYVKIVLKKPEIEENFMFFDILLIFFNISKVIEIFLQMILLK